MLEHLKQKKHQIFPGAALAVFLLFFGIPASGDLYDFYVDASSSAAKENGSEAYPFKTIGAAIRHIESESFDNKNIFVKKGTYAEQVELTSDSNLIGENRSETIIDATGRAYGIYFRSTNSQLSNLTVKKAVTNIRVNKRSRAVIANCTIKESMSDGIIVDRSGNSKKYKFTFKYGSVEDSGKRGMYIFKRQVEIRNSLIRGSGEEGVDLHASLRGIIRDNEIKSNGESGIEMILAGTKITIKGNSLSSNGAQGIAIQVYNSKRGTVKLTSNSIRNNGAYGVRYARYDRGKLKMKFKDFIAKCVKRRKNSIGANSGGDYGYQ
ncbi:MAG: seg [Candidatus Moranbacteria bacterium GW2011_GWC1_45_18]|nr:MAG: hypothetical protein UT79_C0006G0022 [Candidatus Moranbacteria bacterium GW2011_GWC2_40_12]KKT33156.1 MAG: hypothetical protein UW19_C0011G0020 [Candidatus Moranbacteria bacterium GW2011_GWF2_44_10]KKT72115.1 MAG: hypothetical protein UW66_C0013G0005 [Candidatus Moranbacteria bacterium GW2011_GWF1_44_4]KKT99071.1 MAG: seg [Candidatus Moranbacteria bacterium GW2011_GWC1_45_18]